MPILSFPALSPSRADWRLIANSRVFSSPFNRSVQTLELAGAVWAASLDFALLSESQWRDLAAFVAELRGQAGRFYLAPPHAKNPKGVATGTPLVNGASQTGASLITDGWTASVTGILKRGDFLAFDSAGTRELHLVRTTANSDALGNATLAIEPPIRASPADNATVIVNSPACVMRLVDDEQGNLAIRPPVLGALRIEAIESFF